MEECLKKCDKLRIVWKMSQEVVWVGREYDKYIRRKNLRTFFKLLECVALTRGGRAQNWTACWYCRLCDLLLGIFMTQTEITLTSWRTCRPPVSMSARNVFLTNDCYWVPFHRWWWMLGDSIKLVNTKQYSKTQFHRCQPFRPCKISANALSVCVCKWSGKPEQS